MIDGSGRFLKESKRSFPSPVTSLFKLSGLANLFPRSKLFASYYLGHLDESKTNEADVLAGAFMMVKKKIFNELGGFDESFFMYGEDIDLSYRIQKAGYKNYYFADSTIIHFKGESTKKTSLNYVRVFYKAMSIFVKKHYGSEATFFKIMIQGAIYLSACISATARFASWGVMNVTDAAISLEDDKYDKTLIAGTPDEYMAVNDLIQRSGLNYKVLGRIKINKDDEAQTIGSIEHITTVLNKNAVTEIILCEGMLSFKDLIGLVRKIPHHVRIKFYTSCSENITGS